MVNIKENIAIAPYTVFKIGGPADYFCEVKNTEELKEALNWAGEKKAPFFILGAGSNLLVSDEGFRGLVIKMNLQELALRKSDFPGKSDFLSVGAGVSMARAVNFAIENGLGGFEWGIGVPGSIGGSVFGNAGCYGSEMKDVVEKIEILSSPSAQHFADHAYSPAGELLFSRRRAAKGSAKYLPSEEFKIIQFSNKDCDFSYRHSIFKKHPEWIILGATLKLVPSNPNESRAKVLEYSKKRITEEAQASGNKGAQEIGAKCAGCIFKNFTPIGASGPVSAGFLIDTVGLKGKTIGGAKVSEKHANFIINTGDATAADIKNLIKLIKSEVQKKYGIDLETEIRFL
ncbi:MAG: FAD-binding protein [bacterium]|nr:FAD-binding protein [bacterium]